MNQENQEAKPENNFEPLGVVHGCFCGYCEKLRERFRKQNKAQGETVAEKLNFLPGEIKPLPNPMIDNFLRLMDEVMREMMIESPSLSAMINGKSRGSSYYQAIARNRYYETLPESVKGASLLNEFEQNKKWQRVVISFPLPFGLTIVNSELTPYKSLTEW